MKKSQVRKFFKVFSEKEKQNLKIYLTGGIAAMFYGGARPTEDIDFAISLSNEEIVRHLDETSQFLSVPIQYSTDIQRWGMINIPDYQKGAAFLFSEASIDVYVLSPEKWGIGKLSRFFEDDVQDLYKVFSTQKPDLKKCLKYWERALAESPDSPAKKIFKNNVNYFLRKYSEEIWGIPNVSF